MIIDRELYEEVILDHNRHPFHYMEIPAAANRRGYGFNPLCGDEFTLHLTVAEGIIRQAGFEGVGCALSVASASLMTEAVEGRTVVAAEALWQRMTAFLHGEVQGHGLDRLEILAGVWEFPSRIKCANLAWHILRAALRQESHTVCTE